MLELWQRLLFVLHKSIEGMACPILNVALQAVDGRLWVWLEKG